jgi:hypothetical protein
MFERWSGFADLAGKHHDSWLVLVEHGVAINWGLALAFGFAG